MLAKLKDIMGMFVFLGVLYWVWTADMSWLYQALT